MCFTDKRKRNCIRKEDHVLGSEFDLRVRSGTAAPTVTHTIDSKTILPASSVASALGGSSRGPAPPYCTHYGMRHKGDCWRLTGACLVCGSNEHKEKDCHKAHFFTAPGIGVRFQQYRRATRTTRVLHHRVRRDKQHSPCVDRMPVLQLGHMQ